MPDGLRVKSTRTGQTVTPPRQPAQGLYPQDGGVPPVAWPTGLDRPRKVQIGGELVDVIQRQDGSVWRGNEQVGTINAQGQFVATPPSGWEQLGQGALTAFGYAMKPFEYAQEYVATPIAEAITAPWWSGQAEQVTPGQFTWEDIQALFPGGAYQKAYEEWESPWGVKGALEMAPWLALPGAGQLAGWLGRAGKAGQLAAKALGPAAAIEAAPGKLIGKGVKALLPKAKLMPDLRTMDDVVDVAFQDDFLRRVAGLPEFKWLAKLVGGLAATAKTPVDRAIVARAMLRHEGSTKAMVAASTLRSSKKVFTLAEDGTIATGSMKGTHLNTIRTYPDRYAGKLTKEQKAWIKQADELEKAKLELLKRNKIEINELSFDEGGRYAGRRVYAKFDPAGELSDYGFVGAGPGRLGAKAGFEKMRIFKTAEEALEQGYRYLPEEDALALNIRAAYNRVADKEMADWLMPQIPWRTAGAPEPLVKAAASAGTQYKRSKNLVDAINRAIRGEKVPKVTLTAIAKSYPNEARTLGRLIRGEAPARASRAEAIIREVQATHEITKQKLVSQGFDEALVDDVLRNVYKINPETDEIGAKLLFENLPKNLTDDILSENIQRETARHILGRKLGVELHEIDMALETGPMAFRKMEVVAEATQQAKAIHNAIKGALPTKAQVRALGETIPKPTGMTAKREMIALRNKSKPLHQKAQTEYLQAVSTRAKARRQALQTAWGEERIPYPAFAGKIFTGPEAKATVKSLRAAFEPEFSEAMNAVNKVNAVGRYFALAGDVSPATIQLIFLAGANPKVYGKAMLGFIRSMFNPEFHAKYLSKHMATVQGSPDLILTRGGVTEFTEAMARGGLLRKGPLKVAGKVLEPFMRGFETSLDVAGIEMKEALSHLGTTAARNAQVDAFINEFRGLMSTARLGVPVKQRQLETVSVLAPMYNRAIGALLGDVLRGNLRGELARKSLAKGVTAIAAMTVAVSYAKGETEEEMLKHFDMRSPEFMTWDVGGQRIGPGSKVRSLMATWGKSIDEPENVFKLSMDNPNLRFVRGNLSPAMSTGLDLLTGEDFIGDPTRDGLLSLSKTVLAENLLPIWVQSVALEGGDSKDRAIRGAGEFLGMRAYPQSEWQEVKNLREGYSEGDFNKKYEELNREERDKLQADHPDYKELRDEVVDQMVYETGDDIEIWAHKSQKDSDAEYHYHGEVSATALFNGQIDYRTYLDEESTLRKTWRGRAKERENIKDYATEDELKGFDDWREDQPEEDKALDRYWEIRSDLRRTDTGQIDWSHTEERIDKYLESLDEETRNYILRMKDRSLRNLPPKMMQIAMIQSQGRDVVSEYYDQPEGRERTLFRRTNPTVDAWLLIMGRVTRPQSELAARMAMEMLQQRGLPQTLLTGGVTPATGAPAGAQMGTGRPRTMRVKSLR